MAESGGRPDSITPMEEDERGGRGPDSGGDGGTGGTVGIPWLVAGPDGKHSGVKGGPTLTPPRPPKTTNSKSTNSGKPNPKTLNSTTSGPSGSSKPKTLASHEASKPASTEASKLTTPSKHTKVLTSTPIRSNTTTRDVSMDLTGNPEDTMINPTLTHDVLGNRRTTPDGFTLRSNGTLFNSKTGQSRIPTTEERLAWSILDRQAEQRKQKRVPPQITPTENAQDRLKRNASQLSQDSTNPDKDAKKTKPNETEKIANFSFIINHSIDIRAFVFCI